MGIRGDGDLKDAGVSSTAEERILIKVHVCGEVVEPGVYEAEKGSRVIDLIKIAGGETEEACLDSLNLAQEVFDGQKIYVPSQEEAADGDISGISPSNTRYTWRWRLHHYNKYKYSNIQPAGKPSGHRSGNCRKDNQIQGKIWSL